MGSVPIKHDAPAKVNPLAERLLAGRLHDPFGFLGLHRDGAGYVLRAFHPRASEIWVQCSDGWQALAKSLPGGLYEWRGAAPPATPCRLRVHEGERAWEVVDPYGIAPRISDHDLYLFNEGRLTQAYRTLGPHPMQIDGITGVRFAVWAPNAERVSVVGDFNGWDGRIHPMSVHGSSGVWELFLPGLAPDSLYKYEIRNRDSGAVFVKTDPYAQAFELRPGTAARVTEPSAHRWQDGAWMSRRARCDWLHAPMNVYEVHAGSWMRHPDGRFYTYRELAEHLIPYVKDMGFTHVELLPVSEHPLDESWGYQTTGYFAVTSRYGSADDFRALVDACHRADLGVILDWVPAHFPGDAFALAHFDGTALYEHEDPRLGKHQDWGTHIFNYGRNEVKGFLLASAHYWLSEFHLDGLRVDAVASLLYLDYSRKEGEWLPNRYGGRENLEAIDFLHALNVMVHEQFPGVLTLAEESTAWPAVSRPVYLGGLGFSMKWNMGWMNDTLSYMHHDPVHRRFHHNELTFGQLYAYTENFVLPLSHDEVVHGKGSLLSKMPGDAWQKFANLRLLFAYQMTQPGKKLNFMGNEFGQGAEWRVEWELDWWQLSIGWHRGMQTLLRDLNRLYRTLPALHELDFSQDGFAWIDCHDADQSVLSYLRRARDGSFAVVALNFTPVPRHGYLIGVPDSGAYREIFNSDSQYYGGGDVGNGGILPTNGKPWMGLPDSLTITLPPLAGVIFVKE
ncbi:MAG: 1,4-alpha-glucan branching protein GlgB [Betaproteobacteria bacterium]|nr:1,4-alpha-glucan branching protein GlgB [Betaproteobacteria bacterium]